MAPMAACKGLCLANARRPYATHRVYGRARKWPYKAIQGHILNPGPSTDSKNRQATRGQLYEAMEMANGSSRVGRR